MLKVALTGNIASGKSKVEKFFEDFGVKVLDTDKIVAALYSQKEFALELAQKFSNYDLLNNGIVSKEKISKIIFKLQK